MGTKLHLTWLIVARYLTEDNSI